jgi:hypothetical protein
MTLMTGVISTIFSNPSWTLSQAVAFPNQLGRLDHDGAIIGAVLVLRGRGQDFALGVAGLEYVTTAEKEGRITDAYVVLAQRSADGGRREFIAAEKAAVVHERLREYAPREGQFGRYWWISVEFVPATSMGLSPDAPF